MTESDQTITTTFVEYSAAIGSPEGRTNPDGSPRAQRFTLTDPLEAAGVDRSDPNAAVVFNDVDDEGILIGEIRDADEVGTGKNSANVRAVATNNNAGRSPNAKASLSLLLNAEWMDDMGVDIDAENDNRAILNVFASEDGYIAFQKLREREVAHESIDDRLYELPTQIRKDYVAVVEEGYTADEWADERGLTRNEDSESEVYDAAYYVRQNVEKAKDILNDPDGEGRDLDEQDVETNEGTIVRVLKTTLNQHSTGGFRVEATAAIERALRNEPDKLNADKMGIEYDYMSFDDMVPGVIETGEAVQSGVTNERWGSVDDHATTPPGMDEMPDDMHAFRVLVPQRVLEELGYDLDNADDAPIDVWGGDGMIAFSPPKMIQLSFPSPVPAEQAAHPSDVEQLTRKIGHVDNVTDETIEALLEEFGRAHFVMQADEPELENAKGVGAKTAAAIAAASSDVEAANAD